MIYLDSSALMKLVRSEAETVALGHWLDERSEQPMVTSELGRVEVASAMLLVEGLTAFIAYDDRLLDAAQDRGLTVASPGRNTA